MYLLKKIKKTNNRKQIYFCGIKIFSYKRKSKSKHCNFQNTVYGKVYYPYYNSSFPPSSIEPEIYNKEGKLMRTFFLRDFHMAADKTQESKYFIWDKFNIGLKTHFYTHQAMLETMGKPTHKYGWLIESEGIVPNDYKLLRKNPNLASEFNKIFTYSEDLLDKLPNAELLISCANIWYGNIEGDTARLNSEQYKNKEKMCSMMCSEKLLTKMHYVRHNIATQALSLGVDVYGKFNGGMFIPYKSKSLEKYRYQIVVENDISPYYFTEKILDCFASQTVPIYLGATKIDKFFNPDGIIFIKQEDVNNIEKYLKQISVSDYESRIPALIEIYEKSLIYCLTQDLIYEKIKEDLK